MAGYDIRYSTSPIDGSSWSTATPIAPQPSAATPGSAETFTVTDLSPSTTYYLALKSFDYITPANVSVISNVVSAKTLPPVQAVTVHNPWLTNDRVADTHNINTMAATYINAYTPDGVIPPTSDEQKAINIYDNQKRRLYHWTDEPPSVGGSISDPTFSQNVFGWALCGRHADEGMTLAQAAGLGSRNVGVPGHNIYEVFYDGGWHLYDTMTTMYVYTKTTPRHVASLAEISADHSIVLDAMNDGRACPGFLLCGDTPSWYANSADSWTVGGTTPKNCSWTGNMDLRLGETFKRTWESWPSQYPTPRSNADAAPGNDPPYHHEANKDWKDTVNFPYWEPYVLSPAQTTELNIPIVSYRRWANGTETFAPDFRSTAYLDSLEPNSTNIAAYYSDQITPDLHPATANADAVAVFKIAMPYFLTDATLSGDFVRATSSDTCTVYMSTDNIWWTQVYSPAVGTTHLSNYSLHSFIWKNSYYGIPVGLYGQYYIKIQMRSTAKSHIGVSNLAVTTTFEHNKGAMAYLDKGVNHITLTFDNLAQLQASHNVLHVVYHWKEYDGSDWNIDKQYDGYFAASPSVFTINVGGDKVPRTEYITMEVVPPLYDQIAPGQIVDLTAGTAGSANVPLSWTATGNDGTTGTAMAYDLRFSTTPITDQASFEAATQALGTPSPSPAGTQEVFDAKGLAGGTTYYFAVEAIDAGSNHGPLSNVVSATTSPAPRVTDLAVGATTCSKVALSWTAIDDGNVGQETSYDLRYSTAPITNDASFAAATQVTGTPAPKPMGQAETFDVPGLIGGTTYYFAIKGVDGFGVASPLSNVVSATTAPTPQITDLNGSAGSNKVTLTWTAVTDGDTGAETSYDLRYSATPITDDSSFATGIQAVGVPAPRPAGVAETFTVTGLSGSTDYWLAIKAVDSFGHATLLSNIVQVTTTPPDVTAPQWVGNLVGRPSATSGGVDLTWTAPADYGYDNAGPFPCATYQLRYSTSPILYDDGDATWNTATQLTGLPVPQAPGSSETLTVSGLTSGATYYFAIRAADDSGNLSEVSNCAPGMASVIGETTLQPGLSGYSGESDSYYVGQSDSNYGGSNRMVVTGWADSGVNNIQRCIVKFDLSTIPAGTTITSATLSLYSYYPAQTKGSGGQYGVYAVTAPWSEGQVTWNVAASSTSWATPGGDFMPDPDATCNKLSSTAVPAWYNWDVTNRVNSWLSGTSDNDGWIVKCTDENIHNQDYLYPKEGTTVSNRPKLVLSDLAPTKTGDANGDNLVNVGDLLELVGSWGKNMHQRGYEPATDFNSDSYINVGDLQILIAHWNS